MLLFFRVSCTLPPAVAFLGTRATGLPDPYEHHILIEPLGKLRQDLQLQARSGHLDVLVKLLHVLDRSLGEGIGAEWHWVGVHQFWAEQLKQVPVPDAVGTR